jgi:hypothetical protein
MLYVGISSWIIQDGNYRDFRVGETARFALEFYPHMLEVDKLHQASFERIRASRYRIRGQVVYVGRSVWVIDFGVMAYQNEEPPRATKEGSWIEGNVYLGVDPFFYFEDLQSRPGMPALQYDWHIKTILLETTPWLSHKDEKGRTTLTRDEQRESFVEVAETNAWDDDEGLGHYVLECERIGQKLPQ